jgi:tetratricopeptide (TPR) repeat protein
MPPEVQSMRAEILSQEGYEERAEQWRTYVDRHPESAYARVQLARAYRYSKLVPAEERNELISKAHELDPTCPEALEAIAHTGLHSKVRIVDSLEEARDYAMRAVELAPHWPEPHFTLWSLATVLGREKEAHDHLEAIVRKRGYPPPILDFGHNLLVSAEPGAIILTNGDNDTYPPLALQIAHGTREDVAIVNLSLLNQKDYAHSIWKTALGADTPFSEKELKNLWKEAMRKTREGEIPSSTIVRALLAKVESGEWKRPVYFAITVYQPVLDACPLALRIEGLLWRVLPEPGGEREDADPPIDAARSLELFRETFRLESATDLAHSWSPTDAATNLLKNYPALLRIVATRRAEAGDLEGTRFALREAIRILDFHGEEEMRREMAAYWKELDPDNPEIERWQ